MHRDSIRKTLLVATLLSVVCSVFVSSAAVFLKPNQERNKEREKKKNVLLAAGMMEEGKSVDELFNRFEVKVVNLATGEYNEAVKAENFDQRKAARSLEEGIEIERENDFGRIKRRAKNVLVYIARDDAGKIQELVLPVHGKGLWSTLYAFIALAGDLNTINGFSVYEHGETPGLGGEVENPRWKAQWVGKKAFDANGNVRITVLKGKVNQNDPAAPYEIDGLSGATFTSRGVKNLLKYWLGKNGFGPYLDHLRKERDS